jgi:ATP-dependent Clp protease protease subunit
MKTYFRMRTTGNGAEIMIYDEIGANTAPAFDAELKALGDVKSLNVRINSPGGDVFDAMAIYNMIKGHKATVTATVDGIAASAASLIAMGADKIVMPENSFMLIHRPSGMTVGTSEDHATMAANLAKMADQFASVYASRSRNSIAAVKALMKKDEIMSAAECKAAGYCDEIVSNARMVATFELSKLPAGAMMAFNRALSAAPRPPPSSPMTNEARMTSWREASARVRAEMSGTGSQLWRLYSNPKRGSFSP